MIKYGEARPYIRSGDLLFWTHRGWGSWYDIKVQAVRMWQRSEYSHVATAVMMAERVWVLEAVMPVPRVVPLSNLLPCWWIPMHAPWRKTTEVEAFSIIGKPRAEYSQWQAIKGGLGLLHPGDDDLWMCAELTWCVAHWDDIELGAKITPSALSDAAQRRPGGSLNYLEA